MTDADNTTNLKDQLVAHRERLAVLLKQQATLGEAHAPPGVALGIAEARVAIMRLKAALRDGGDTITDLPNDVEPLRNAVPSAPPVQQQLARLTLLLEGDVQRFTPEEQASCIFLLSRAVNINPEHIRIVYIGSGSIKLVIELPEDVAARLISLYTANDPALQKLPLLAVYMEKSPVEQNMASPADKPPYRRQITTTIDTDPRATHRVGRAINTARIKAFLVYLYTASTMAVLLLSASLLLHDQLTLALFVMLLAVVIDSSDGMLARHFRVKKVVPELDGRRLDDIVDYASYVFLPVVFMLKAQMLSEPVVLFGSLPLLASAFGFSRVDAKLDDEGFFVGFPSYWNIIVAYLYMLSAPPWLNTLIIIVLAAMVFIPTRYLYITRLHPHRWLHIGGMFICGLLLLAGLLVQDPTRRLLLYFSLTYPVYYTIYSFVLDRRARKAAR